MRMVLAAAALATLVTTAVTTSAFAQCSPPPPGLPMQQWYGLCAGVLQQAYARGMGGGMPYNAFVTTVYQQYAAASVASSQPHASPGLQTCPLGATQCSSGWARTCKAVGNGTMWITGAQRC